MIGFPLNYNAFSFSDTILNHVLKLSFYFKLYNSSESILLDTCNFPYRYGSHYDVGIITLSHIYNINGFQIYNKLNNKWYNINENDYESNNIFVINGKHMEYLTNGYWKGCIHRVLNNYITNKDRLALLFFTQPFENNIIYPINGCNICNKSNNNNYKHIYGKSINQIIKETKHTITQQ